MTVSCTGIILAGGLNTRFSGRQKGLIPLAGKRILDRIFENLAGFFEEILLITNDPLSFLDWDCKIFTDVYSARSSLTGIHSGLFYTATSHAFVTACDTPFLKPEIIQLLLDQLEAGADIVIPQTALGLEPLCAIYSKACLPSIESSLSQGLFKIQQAFRHVRLKKVPETLLREKDPDLISFFNVNTPEDLARAEARCLISGAGGTACPPSPSP